MPQVKIRIYRCIAEEEYVDIDISEDMVYGEINAMVKEIGSTGIIPEEVEDEWEWCENAQHISTAWEFKDKPFVTQEVWETKFGIGSTNSRTEDRHVRQTAP